MEVRDGFIVGVFNYCDRWCETCAFTARCRLFADVAEIEAKLDPHLKAVVDAPPLPEEAPPPPPKWMQEWIDEMNEATRDAEPHEELPRRRQPPADHQAIEARADEYHTRAYAWLHGRSWSSHDVHDPCAVICWFHMQIMIKVHRAVHALVEEIEDNRDAPRDSDGSAKVALLGIDRSHAAWLDLVERGVITRVEVEPFIADLVWLGESLERVFPKARAFVRPGLDEPDQVSRLIAQEGG
ncbi:MAG TPA: hypothetical protein VKB50_27765 [Vicinamibacterales bacterium]|nr:hypothetical protein [Vicinamibacterales bacterium]